MSSLPTDEPETGSEPGGAMSVILLFVGIPLVFLLVMAGCAVGNAVHIARNGDTFAQDQLRIADHNRSLTVEAAARLQANVDAAPTSEDKINVILNDYCSLPYDAKRTVLDTTLERVPFREKAEELWSKHWTVDVRRLQTTHSTFTASVLHDDARCNYQ